MERENEAANNPPGRSSGATPGSSIPERREVSGATPHASSNNRHGSLESDDATPRNRLARDNTGVTGITRDIGSVNLNNSDHLATSSRRGEKTRPFNPHEANHLAKSLDPSTDDILCQLRCAICYVQWCNLVIRCCRHLNCDVCLTKYRTKCGQCRGEVSGVFPIRFHSAHMISDLNLPFPSDNRYDIMESLLGMEFERAKIRRAICHVSASTATLTVDAILSFLDKRDNATEDVVESAYSIPTPEEMESFLTNPDADTKVKARLSEWLQVTGKCIVCKEKTPSICLMPCYHLALCLECYEAEPRHERCPDAKCDRKIENQVKIHV